MAYVSIIILNFNGRQFLKDCLDSVLNQSFKDFEIIFVDNGSSDGSEEFVSRQYNDERLKVISTGKNLGFAGGNNFGLMHCKYDYIVLLNNDVIVKKNWLSELVKAYENQENAGLVQSLILTEGIPKRYYKKNGTINFLGHNIMEVFEIDESGTGEIFLASGASMIFNKSILISEDTIFPEEYFLYSEDTYLSFLSKFSGKTNYHTSGSVVHHKGCGTTIKEKPETTTFYQERNRILNFLIFFRISVLIRLIPYYFFNLIMKLTLSLVNRKYSLTGILKSYWWIFTNREWIKSQRKQIIKFKSAGDNDVIKFLSCKLFNGNNILEKNVNYISKAYCFITGLRTFEFKNK